MPENIKNRCPECNTKADVNMNVDNKSSDVVVKATSEEVVMELTCNAPDCNKVWRAVYSFNTVQ